MPATTTTLPGPVTTEDPWSEAVCKGANKPDYFVTNESSKLIRQGDGTYLVRLLMGGVPETDPYTGLFVVSKKKCGKNFVEALNNRQIQYESSMTHNIYDSFVYLGFLCWIIMTVTNLSIIICRVDLIKILFSNFEMIQQIVTTSMKTWVDPKDASETQTETSPTCLSSAQRY